MRFARVPLSSARRISTLAARYALGVAIACFFMACALGPAEATPMKIVVLRGLDKITAHVSTFDAPVGETVSFGVLRITARACDKHPPEETPEDSAFLEIVEARPGEQPQNSIHRVDVRLEPSAFRPRRSDLRPVGSRLQE